MQINNTKVKAFALQEMIVVLLITTIVVGMAFSVLNLVQKQMMNIEGIYEVKLEANKLRQSLWLDFNDHSYVFYDAKENRLYCSNALDSKNYGFMENLLIKERDTFDVQIESAQFYFNNEATVYGEVDAIELITSKETGNQRIFVYKENAAATYMNKNK